MEIFIESLLIAVIALVVVLGYTKASMEWWTPDVSWKVVGILFVIVTIVLEIAYWIFIK